jgi:hypothetical protein
MKITTEQARAAVDRITKGDPAKFRPAELLLAWLAQLELERIETRDHVQRLSREPRGLDQ